MRALPTAFLAAALMVAAPVGASPDANPLCDPAMPLDFVTCDVAVVTGCMGDVQDYSIRRVLMCAPKVQV